MMTLFQLTLLLFSTAPSFALCAPDITQQPMNTAACLGEEVQFSVVVTGQQPFTYQWRKNLVPIPGEIGPTLDIASVTDADYGSYHCVVSNSCGTVTSAPAELSPNEDIQIINQPLSTSVCPNEPVSLLAYAVGSNLTYQWTFQCEPIPGAVDPTLDLDPLTPEETGSYACIITSDCTTVATDTAQVSFSMSPMVITSQSQNQTACVGQGVFLYVSVSSTEPFTLQWYKDNVPMPNMTTENLTATVESVPRTYFLRATYACGSVDSDPIIVSQAFPVITQQPVSTNACPNKYFTLFVNATGSGLSYRWYRNNVQVGTARTLKLLLTASTVGSYRCRIRNSCNNEVYSNTVNVGYISTGAFTVEPPDQTVSAGANVSFTAVPVGEGPFTYAWYKNNVLIPGATLSTYALTGVTEADAGTYRCTVTTTCHTMNTDAVLTVNPAKTGAP